MGDENRKALIEETRRLLHKYSEEREKTINPKTGKPMTGKPTTATNIAVEIAAKRGIPGPLTPTGKKRKAVLQ
jgi:hypothetical protein